MKDTSEHVLEAIKEHDAFVDTQQDLTPEVRWEMYNQRGFMYQYYLLLKELCK